MKKVIILAIVFIYLASIVVVNFFGLEVAIFEGTVYVEDISVDKITRYDIKGTGTPYVVYKEDAQNPGIVIGKKTYELYEFPFTPAPEGEEYTAENTASNPNQVTLSVMVRPLEANSKGIQFVYDEAATEGKAVFYEDKLTVVFLKPDARISLTLVAVDGSNVMTEKFYLVAKSSLAG